MSFKEETHEDIMQMRSAKAERLILLGLLAGFVSILPLQPSEGNTGMENIAYSAKSAARGGTAVALGGDSTAMNVNPATISMISGGRLDANLEVMFPSFSFQNKDATAGGSLNTTKGKRPTYLVPSAGLVYQHRESNWAFGLGMFSEGGTGTDYGTLKVDNGFLEMSPAGSPDVSWVEYSSRFGYMKLTPTVAYKITGKVSLGLSSQLGYSTMRMKMPFFMDQNGNGVPDALFSADMKGEALSIGWKIGLLYKLSDTLGLGVAYSGPVDIRIKGDAAMVAPLPQMGGMLPAQARMEGNLEMDIGWPPSVKGGMFWTMGFLGGTVLAFDIEWLDWSHYYDSIPVRLRHVTLNGAPQPDQAFRMDLRWKDQWVFKLGFEYPVTDNLTLKIGYVYGKNPISSAQGMLAVMNPFVEHHLTGGFGYTIGETYEINLAAVYGINQYERVGNRHNFAPDMQNSRTGMEFLSAAAMMSYRF